MLETHKILRFQNVKIGIYTLKYPISAVENSLLTQNKMFSKGVKIGIYAYTYVRNSLNIQIITFKVLKSKSTH